MPSSFRPQEAQFEFLQFSRGNNVEVSVSDEGKGIPPEMLDSIFDRFKQVSGASIGGSGLGLAICKSFIDLHGGKIWAVSVIGKGSTFKFIVPAATTPSISERDLGNTRSSTGGRYPGDTRSTRSADVTQETLDPRLANALKKSLGLLLRSANDLANCVFSRNTY